MDVFDETGHSRASENPGVIITLFLLLGVLTSGCEYWEKDHIVGSDHSNTRPTVLYRRDIQPIFDDQCILCHGKQGRLKRGGLDVTSYDSLMAGGNSGAVIIPGDATKSLLVKRITGVIFPQMPNGVPPISDNEINLIITWIKEGALNN